MTLSLTILGCGSSAGVPRPALGWGACDPNNPKNRRRRCSLLAECAGEHGVTRVLIDTSPDLREQLIDANVDHIDAVFLTHEHADQTHGIDDLRSVVLHQRRRIPVYLNKSTADHILLRFSYCFVSPPDSDYPPILDNHVIEAGESRTIEGKGGQVGPDLTGIGARPKADILAEIIDPNRSVEGTYRQWIVDTRDDTLFGRLLSENATSIEIVDAQAQKHVIQRNQIKKLRASDLSVMPEGFEQIGEADLTHLLEFISASKVKH